MSCNKAWRDVDVLGVKVAAVTAHELTEAILDIAGSPNRENPFFLTYLNAACSNIAADDPDYYTILKNADCVYADGQSIVWASRQGKKRLPERVNAGDFIVSLLQLTTKRGVRIGLLGGRAGVASRAAETWVRHSPGLQVIFSGDGFFNDDASVVDDIASAEIDLLLVGLGVPYQEKWAWENRQRLKCKVIWCVGALFEYFGEGRSRAPFWMRRMGLEWVYRLVLEPRRLWRRYLIGNVRFVKRVLLNQHR